MSENKIIIEKKASTKAVVIGMICLLIVFGAFVFTLSDNLYFRIIVVLVCGVNVKGLVVALKESIAFSSSAVEFTTLFGKRVIKKKDIASWKLLSYRRVPAKVLVSGRYWFLELTLKDKKTFKYMIKTLPFKSQKEMIALFRQELGESKYEGTSTI